MTRASTGTFNYAKVQEISTTLMLYFKHCFSLHEKLYTAENSSYIFLANLF